MRILGVLLVLAFAQPAYAMPENDAPTGAAVDIRVTVPPVVFGGTAGAVLVFVHPSAGAARLTGCGDVTPPTGRVVRLRCAVPPRGRSMTVRVRTAYVGTFAHTYPS